MLAPLKLTQPFPSSISAPKFWLLFAACFLIPLIAAQLFLSQAWYSAGVTNKGHWITQPATLISPNLHSVHWSIAYINSGSCDEQCQLTLHHLEQLYTRFGRQQSQIHLVFISDALGRSIDAAHWNKAPISADALAFNRQILILNQAGTPILYYSAPINAAEFLQLKQDIKSDLQHLINFDRGVQ